MTLSPKIDQIPEQLPELQRQYLRFDTQGSAVTVEKSALIASFRDAGGPEMAESGSIGVPEGADLIAESIEGCEIYLCRDMKSVAGIWTRFQSTAEMTPFQRYEWLDHWLARVSDTARVEPLIAMVFEGGAVRLIAPLAVESGGLAARLVWLGHDMNDYSAPLVDGEWLARTSPRAARRIWRCITHADHGADYIHLTRQPAYLGPCRNPFIGADPARFSCDSHFLTLSDDWRRLYGMLRSAKSRRRLREKVRRLEKSGPIRFRRIRGSDAIAEMIATLLDWKQEQLNGRGSRNPFANGLIGRQLTALATDAATSAMVRVYCLEVDGRPLAATVALAQGGVFNFFVSAYNDAGHRNTSPGTIMLVRLIELASRAGYSKFDFSMGDEPYKAEWCDGRMVIFHQTEPLTFLGVPLAALARLSIAVKRGIKANDLLLGALQTVNAHRIALMRGLGAGARA